ncbi:OmpP1/FadL family transporter [Piscirickettsia litoralis]|uniref:OmpP1/FadL family transporter n=1 Tax=Piscirickettsia litoralis TaxID=1891921 RepID=UPI000B0CEA40|nr:outer membrane protein transport protein [Piscirickettsia litoralis]
MVGIFKKSKFDSKGLSSFGPYEETATAWSQGYIVGALYQWTENTSIGLSYNHFFETNLDATGTYHSKIAAQFPDTINIGLRHRVNDKLTVMLNLQEVLWRQFYLQQHTEIASGMTSSAHSHLNLKNSHLLSAGLAYRFTRKNVLDLGIGVDDGKFTISSRRLWLSAGLSHRFSKQCSIGLSYLYGSKQTSTVEAENPVTLASGGNTLAEQVNTLTMQSSNIVQIVALGFHYRF